MRPALQPAADHGALEFAAAPRAEAKPQHIFVLGNDVSMLVNFQGPLIKAMLEAGHRVTAAATGRDRKAERWLATQGVPYREIAMQRAGLNPVRDSATLVQLIATLRETRPDFLFAYTIKPVVYGLLAARLVGVKRRAAMITGLGYAFTEDDTERSHVLLRRRAIRRAARTAYSTALRFADTVIFQNPDDRALFDELGLLKRVREVGLVQGSGVDVDHFTPQPVPAGPPVALMIARLLRDKGLYEYVEAARIVKRERPEIRFRLVGPFDPNPASVSPHEIDAWASEGLIEYRGAVTDVRPHIAACHIFVLPSYREGTPRTVLEAMAMGRPIITTDVPGCRETVVQNENGLLVPVRNAPEIARAILDLARQPERRLAMGAASLRIVRERYEAKTVSNSALQLMGLLPSDLDLGKRPEKK